MMDKIFSKSGQEEMVGFALIIILVSVILLVFLGIFLSRGSGSESVESYEVESFVQASLQYTTDCKDNFGYLSVRELIFDCDDEETCLDERDTCEVLNSTLREIIEESWDVGQESPVKGYNLEIIYNEVYNEENSFILNKGNVTSNSKGSVQEFSRGGDSVELNLVVYY